MRRFRMGLYLLYNTKKEEEEEITCCIQNYHHYCIFTVTVYYEAAFGQLVVVFSFLFRRCVDYLLQHKADLKLKDKKGYCAIHYSVAGGNYAALTHLLKYVDSNYRLYDNDVPAFTPLHIAVRRLLTVRR